jgi:hypothetical protein
MKNEKKIDGRSELVPNMRPRFGIFLKNEK